MTSNEKKPLVDDLADVLAGTVVGWEPIIGHDLAEAPEVKRVLARYRAERRTGAERYLQQQRENPEYEAAYQEAQTQLTCICTKFSDTGGFRIADLTCPVHGVNGTHPGDGYWDDDEG